MDQDNINDYNVVVNSWGGRLQNVELMRFVGSLLIMTYHLSILGYEAGTYLGTHCWVWVDFYFIITGAFTYRHYFDKQNQLKDYGSEALRYTFDKVRRFLPFTAIAVLLLYININIDALFNGDWKGFLFGFCDLPFEILYLSSSGIVSARLAPIWFLSAMFIVLPLIVYIMNKHSELWKILALTVPVLYFGRMGVNGSRAWPNDLVRAFAGISLGSFAYMVSIKIAKRQYGVIGKCVLTLFEVGSCMVALYISIKNIPAINLMELLFFNMIVLMLSGVTYSSITNLRLIRFLGEASMPMFIFHWAVGVIVLRFIESLSLRTFMYYFITIITSFALTYVTNLLKRQKRKIS